MDEHTNRRTEQRLRCQWPIWFSGNNGAHVLQGNMIDVSSKATAFTCPRKDFHAYQDQQLLARFNVPQYGSDASFHLSDFIRTGRVQRVDHLNDRVSRVVLQFYEPLYFKPGEQPSGQQETRPSREPALV